MASPKLGWLNRNPLDFIKGNLIARTIIELCISAVLKHTEIVRNSKPRRGVVGSRPPELVAQGWLSFASTMTIRQTTLAAAFALAAIGPAHAHAEGLKPLQGQVIDLGDMSGVAYYTVEHDGFSCRRHPREKRTRTPCPCGSWPYSAPLPWPMTCRRGVGAAGALLVQYETPSDED
jgi:hypothetical protein